MTAGLDSDPRVAVSTLADLPGRQRRQRPDHPALMCNGRVVTYAELDRISNQIGHALLELDLPPGSRIAFLGKESEFYYEIAFGVVKAGHVLVPLNWRFTAGEAQFLLSDSESVVLFAETPYLDLVASVQPELPSLIKVIGLEADGGPSGLTEFSAGRPTTRPPVLVEPEMPAVQIYTSGTTGRPKGVVLPHRSFGTLSAAMASSGLDWVDWQPDDRSLISLPGFHIAGFSWAMQGFLAGITMVVMPMFVSQLALTLIRDLRIATTFMAPAMLQMLLAEPGASAESLQSLRKVVYGGSPISPQLLTAALAVLQADLVQAYAATETGNAIALLPGPDHRPGSPLLAAAGRICPDVELMIANEAGEPQPAGEVGEVLVRTPALMLEYWRLPEATEAAFAHGWLRMGDLGYLDSDGVLFLCDRKKDTIIVAGENVYPSDVESALATHPAVAESAVVGVPHPQWGEALHACIVLRPGERATPRQIMLSLKGKIADYKIPTEYEFVPSLPRNASGKILRRELRAPFWAGRESSIH